MDKPYISTKQTRQYSSQSLHIQPRDWILADVVLFQAGQALTYDELQGLTYLQVKGSGIANTCPVLESGSSNIKDLKSGTYKIEKLCLEPTSFTVKEESEFKNKEAEFQKTRLMTRLTYTLDEVRFGTPVDYRASFYPLSSSKPKSKSSLAWLTARL